MSRAVESPYDPATEVDVTRRSLAVQIIDERGKETMVRPVTADQAFAVVNSGRWKPDTLLFIWSWSERPRQIARYAVSKDGTVVKARARER